MACQLVQLLETCQSSWSCTGRAAVCWCCRRMQKAALGCAFCMQSPCARQALLSSLQSEIMRSCGCLLPPRVSGLLPELVSANARACLLPYVVTVAEVRDCVQLAAIQMEGHTATAMCVARLPCSSSPVDAVTAAAFQRQPAKQFVAMASLVETRDRTRLVRTRSLLHIIEVVCQAAASGSPGR